MSTPDILTGTYVSVLVENPDTPGAFIPLCGMTTRNLTRQVQTRDRFLRDCDDPEDIPVRRLIVTGKQWDLSASGLYNRAQAALLSGLFGIKATYRFLIGEPADDEVYGSYFQGNAVLTQHQITGGDDDDVTAELTWASDGAWVEEVV